MEQKIYQHSLGFFTIEILLFKGMGSNFGSTATSSLDDDKIFGHASYQTSFYHTVDDHLAYPLVKDHRNEICTIYFGLYFLCVLCVSGQFERRESFPQIGPRFRKVRSMAPI